MKITVNIVLLKAIFSLLLFMLVLDWVMADRAETSGGHSADSVTYTILLFTAENKNLVNVPHIRDKQVMKTIAKKNFILNQSESLYPNIYFTRTFKNFCKFY